jgi:hypothetical protein
VRLDQHDLTFADHRVLGVIDVLGNANRCRCWQTFYRSLNVLALGFVVRSVMVALHDGDLLLCILRAGSAGGVDDLRFAETESCGFRSSGKRRGVSHPEFAIFPVARR